MIGIVSKEPAIQADWSHSVANLFCYATGQGTPSSVPLSITASDCDTLSCAIIPLPGQGTAFDDGVSYGWTLIGAPGGQLSSTNQAGATFSATTPGLYFISVGVFDDGGPDGVDDPKLLSCQILVLAPGQTPPGGGDPPPGGGDPVPPVSGEPPGGWDPLPPPWGGLPIAPAPCAEPIWRPGPGIEATIYRNLTLCLQTEPGCPPRPAVSNLTLYGRDLDEWTCDDESGLQGDAVLFSLEDAGGGIVHLHGDGTGTFAATQPGFYRIRIKVDDGGTGARDDPAVFLSVSFTVMASCGCPQPPGWPPFPPLPPGTGPIVGPGPNPPPPPPPCSTYHWQPHTAIDAAVSPSSQTIYLLDEGFEPELASFTVTAEDLDLRGCPGQPETNQPVGDEMFATWAIIDGPTGFTPGADCWVDPSTYGATAGFAAIRPGTYTLEATVDDFARIGPADTGGRDDTPDVVTVTVTVKRPPGSAGDPGSGGYGSEAWFDVYRDEALTQRLPLAPSTIGGVVYPVLHVKVARDDRVTGPASLPVEVQDLYDPYAGNPDETQDFPITLIRSAGWEQATNTGWTPAVAGPAAETNLGGTGTKLYRYKLVWNSMKEPLGNNGDHRLQVAGDAQVEFSHWTGADWTTPAGAGPAAKTVATENVYVTDVSCSNGTIDYFKWDPDGGEGLAHPTISFAIVDADPGEYRLAVHFAPTGEHELWVGEEFSTTSTTVTATERVTRVTVALAVGNNGWAGDHLNAEDHPWGTYTYDIVVTEFQGAAEVDDFGLKQPYTMYIPRNALDDDGDDEDGHPVWLATNELGQDEIRAAYWLQQNGSAGEALELTMVVLDPNLAERAEVAGPREVGAMHGEPDGLPLYTLAESDPAGEWRVVFRGRSADGVGSAERRTHDGQPMLAVNQTQSANAVFRVYSTRQANEFPLADGYIYIYNAFVKLDDISYSHWHDEQMDVGSPPYHSTRLSPGAR